MEKIGDEVILRDANSIISDKENLIKIRSLTGSKKELLEELNNIIGDGKIKDDTIYRGEQTITIKAYRKQITWINIAKPWTMMKNKVR